jgi:hypothetical protein
MLSFSSKKLTIVSGFQPRSGTLGMETNDPDFLHDNQASKNRVAQKKRVLAWGVSRL